MTPLVLTVGVLV